LKRLATTGTIEAKDLSLEMISHSLVQHMNRRGLELVETHGTLIEGFAGVARRLEQGLIAWRTDRAQVNRRVDVEPTFRLRRRRDLAMTHRRPAIAERTIEESVTTGAVMRSGEFGVERPSLRGKVWRSGTGEFRGGESQESTRTARPRTSDLFFHLVWMNDHSATAHGTLNKKHGQDLQKTRVSKILYEFRSVIVTKKAEKDKQFRRMRSQAPCVL
jgi:hypothetical protein